MSGGGGGANKCNRAYWGTLKHKKANFHFFFLGGGGGGEQAYLYFRGTREQVPPPHGRASYRKLLEKHK